MFLLLAAEVRSNGLNSSTIFLRLLDILILGEYDQLRGGGRGGSTPFS